MHTFSLIVDSVGFAVLVALVEAAASLGCLWLLLRAEREPDMSPEHAAYLEQQRKTRPGAASSAGNINLASSKPDGPGSATTGSLVGLIVPADASLYRGSAVRHV